MDCYPLQSTSVITFYSVLLNSTTFANPVGRMVFRRHVPY